MLNIGDLVQLRENRNLVGIVTKNTVDSWRFPAVYVRWLNTASQNEVVYRITSLRRIDV